LEEVLKLTIEKIGEDEENLMMNLADFTGQNNQPFFKQHIPWPELKHCLEKIGRRDIIRMLQDETLLTKGKLIYCTGLFG